MSEPCFECGRHECICHDADAPVERTGTEERERLAAWIEGNVAVACDEGDGTEANAKMMADFSRVAELLREPRTSQDPRSTVEETEPREPDGVGIGEIGGHRFLVSERDGAVGSLAKEVEWTPLYALHTPERQQGWRPISEAPRDGTVVLACWWGAEDPQDRDYEPSVVAFFADGWRDSYGADYNEPTHFQPLPPPPTESESRPVNAPTSEETRK